MTKHVSERASRWGHGGGIRRPTPARATKFLAASDEIGRGLREPATYPTG